MIKTGFYFSFLFYISLMVDAQQTRLSELKAMIAGKSGGEIDNDELINSKGLECSDSTFHISEYKLSIAGKGLKYVEIEENGNELSCLMKGSIMVAGSGTKLYFEYIKCTDKENQSHRLSPLIFTIKDGCGQKLH